MLITVFYDIVDKETGDLIEEYLYVDIEVTEEEYKRIDESCVADIFEGMYEDPSLADICEIMGISRFALYRKLNSVKRDFIKLMEGGNLHE